MGKIDGMPAKAEAMPRDYPWRLTFDENFRLSSWVSPYLAKDLNMALERRELSDLVTLGSLLKHKPLARVKRQRIKKQFSSFVFLDVGRWGGSEQNSHGMQRNFALIWGKWVVLCNFLGFNYNLPDYIDRDKKGSTLLDKFIRALCTEKSAVRVIKKLFCHEVSKPDWNTIHILLPDLHLPVVSGPPKEEIPGRYSELSLTEWYDKYKQGDIFAGGAKDLGDFLLLVATNPVAKGEQLHIAQLGDMYEFWIGIKRMFENKPKSSRLPIEVSAGGKKTIQALVKRTHKENKEVFDALEYVAKSGHAVTYLYGNHDNYVAEPICPKGAGLAERRAAYRKGGLFLEHGHAGDDKNSDKGCKSGHSLTEAVFLHPVIRSFDPNRRAIWTLNAVLSWLEKPDFQIYAMAHTHSPYLTRAKFFLNLSKKAQNLDEAFRNQGLRRL